MGKRAAFRSVFGVLLAFLFLTLPAAASAGKATVPVAGSGRYAQASEPPATAAPAPAPPEPAAGTVPEEAPAAPGAAGPATLSGEAPATIPEMAPGTPAEPTPAAPGEAAPTVALEGTSVTPSESVTPPESLPIVPPGEAAPTTAPEGTSVTPSESVTPPESLPIVAPGAAPAAPAEAAPAAPAEGAPATEGTTKAAEYPDGLIHTVVQGDTLWDLAAKYLGSPWRWTELWEKNRFLTNPHYIYPGIKVVIFPPPPREYAMEVKEPAPEAEATPGAVPPPPSAEEAPPPQVAEAVPAPPPGAPILKITPADCVRGGEFVEKRPRGIGRIIGGTDVRWLFGEGDKVVLSLRKDIPAGQLLGVYRVRGPVRAPAGRRVSGYVKFLVAVIQSQGKENGAAVGVIRKSFEELTKSDIVTEDIPGYAPVAIDPGKEGLGAFVITGRRENEEFGEGDFVYLDRGANDGVARGNVFRIFRRASDSTYDIEVGKAVAIKVLPRFTTVYVVNTTQSFEAGVLATRGVPPLR